MLVNVWFDQDVSCEFSPTSLNKLNCNFIKMLCQGLIYVAVSDYSKSSFSCKGTHVSRDSLDHKIKLMYYIPWLTFSVKTDGKVNQRSRFSPSRKTSSHTVKWKYVNEEVVKQPLCDVSSQFTDHYNYRMFWFNPTAAVSLSIHPVHFKAPEAIYNKKHTWPNVKINLACYSE